MLALFRRLRARVRYRHFERDLAREIETHRALTRADLERDGVPASDVRWRAAQLLGNTTLAREDSRAMWISPGLQHLAQDARYAARGFRRNIGFTVAAIVILTLGLGTTTGGFTVLNGLFLRGWPVPKNAEVFVVNPVFAESAGRVDDGVSYGAYKHIAAHATSADYVASGGVFVRVTASKDDHPPGSVPVGLYVSDNFFQALRIPLELGRPPLPASAGAPPTVVISHQVWQSTFGGDANVLGRTVWLDGQPATIVGVAAREFSGLGRTTMVYAPLGYAADMSARGSVRRAVARDDACCVDVAGRERPGASRAGILAELDGLTSQFRSAAGQARLTLRLADTSSGAALGRSLRPVVLPLFAAGAVLLFVLTCANVGNLYLARTLRRQHEVATRLAIGASRGRLIRQFLTEGLVLSSVAGAIAFAIAAAVPTFIGWSGDDFSATLFAPDWRVATLTALTVILVCAIVSLAPAIRTTRVVWRGGTAVATARTGGLRGGLLAVQIAMATVLILSAALIARGIRFGVTTPSDFRMTSTTAAVLEWPTNGAPEGDAGKVFRSNLLHAVGRADAPMGLSTFVPVSARTSLSTSVRQPATNVDFSARLVPMDSAAADVLGLRLVAGQWASDDDAAREAVINERLARQVFGDTSPVGRPLLLRFDTQIYTVAGVTADAHILSPGVVEPIIHTPPVGGTPVVLTTNTPAAEAEVRTLITSVAPSLSVRFVPLADSIKSTVGDAIIGASMAGGLGIVALLLATIGVYSVFSYLVEERRREIGARVALGANHTQIRSAMFRATRGGIVAGLGTGLALSVIAGILLRSLLFGLSPADPISYAGVGVLLVTTALLATFAPLRRALRSSPSSLLRAE